MGFLMTVGIMIATIAYLWKRRRKTEGGKIAVMLFALVALYPIIAGGSLEKIWLGYLATLLLSAPIPSRMFVNYAHQMPAGQRHEFYYISKGEQVWPSLQRHGIPKGEQVCLLLQPLCCGCFFSGVAGDGTVLLGPDGGVSTGTSRCPDRPDRDGVTAAGITVP